MRYRLRLNISIDQVGEHGGLYSPANGTLQVTEDIEFMAGNFLEIASVLARFHELGQEVQAARYSQPEGG